MHDLVVKNARIVDGTGKPAFAGDVAIRDGRFVEVGTVRGKEREAFDAAGHVVAPGIVDVHTHYDAQLTWDPTASPSPALGVTTVVIGNCGFSLTPAPPEIRSAILNDLAVVEGLSVVALERGVRWDFETFDEYMAMLRRRGVVPNVASFIGHSTVRCAVMGDDASKRAATPSEIQRMQTIVRDAMRTGAVGLASTAASMHVDRNGRPMPSRNAEPEEFRALLQAMGEGGRGVFLTAGTGNMVSQDFLEELAAISGRPVIWSGARHRPSEPLAGIKMAEFCGEATRRGNRMYAQTSCLPHVHEFTLDNAFLFEGCAVWGELRNCDEATMLAALANPDFRARFRDDTAIPKPGVLFSGDWRTVTVSAVSEKNRALEGRTIAAIAAAHAKDPADVFFDLALEERLRAAFTCVLDHADEAAVAGIMAHDATIIALSDAGAHVAFMCDAGYGLHLFGHWVRDTGLFSLEEAVRRVTSFPAEVYGIENRGRIEPGVHADFIVFDPATVGVSRPRRLNDLPGGESRVVSDPVGLRGVWVNGVRVTSGTSEIDASATPGAVLANLAA